MPFNNAVNANQTGIQSLTSAGVWNGRTITAGAGISVANGDGVAGNPVITATGGEPSPLGTVTIVDDFIYADGSNPTGNLNWFVSGGAILTGTAAHPGQIQIGGPGSAGKILMGAAAANTSGWPFILGGGSFVVDFVVNIVATNNATTFLWIVTGKQRSLRLK